MSEPGDIVIGELSEDNIFAGVLVLFLMLGGLIWGAIADGLSFRVGACILICGGLLAAMVPRLHRLRDLKGVGLYVRDDALHFAVSGKSVRLDNIERAYRTSLNGELFKNYIQLEINPTADNPAFRSNANGKPWVINTRAYKTPAAEILARLEAQGVKVRKSKPVLS